MDTGDLSSFDWDPELESGYDKIDSQHKQLFMAVRNLMAASAGGKGNNVVMETLEFLTNYAVKHFIDEEQLQEDYEYPDYDKHKKIHEDFKATVASLVKKVNEEGPTPDIIENVCSIVRAWLLTHIKGDDFHVATFVKAANKKAMSEEQ